MESRLKIIKTYNLYNNGLIDKAKLDAAGIDCFLKNDNTVIIQPFYSNADAGIKLMVKVEDAQIAEEILNDNSVSFIQEEQEFIDEESTQTINAKPGCFSVIAIVLMLLYFCYTNL